MASPRRLNRSAEKENSTPAACNSSGSGRVLPKTERLGQLAERLGGVRLDVVQEAKCPTPGQGYSIPTRGRRTSCWER